MIRFTIRDVLWVLVGLLITQSLLDQAGRVGAAESTEVDATSVEHVTMRPRRSAEKGLGTVAYLPSEWEQPFFARLTEAEKRTGGLAGDYDISKKEGLYVGWFGIVRGIEGDAVTGRTTLMVEHKYFDGLTDSHIQALSFNGSGDFRAVLRGTGHPIGHLTLVKVYGKVSKGADDLPQIEAVFVRNWHWGTFTFLAAHGKQRGSEAWRKLNRMELDAIYDPYPDDAYFEARLGTRSEIALRRQSLRRLALDAAKAGGLPATAVPDSFEGAQSANTANGKIDSATFRTRALQAAKKVRPNAEEMVQPLIDAIVQEGAIDEALETISKQHGEEVSVAVLAEALQCDQEEASYAAAQKLGELGFASRTVVPALIAALHDENQYVRNYAAAALGNIGPEAKEAVPALIVALGDESEHVRAQSSEALGKINVQAEHVVPALKLVLQDDDRHVRFMTVEALGAFGPEAGSAVQPLRDALLHDKDGNVRWSAALPLAAVDADGKIAIPALVEALQGQNPNVRRFAAMALGKFGSKAKEAAPLLLAGLNDKDIGSRIAAAGALWKVNGNSKDTVPVLIQVLEQSPSIAHLWAADEITSIGSDAKAAVSALRKSMEKSPWRDGPARALGSIGPDAAAAEPDLVALLESKNGATRAHAAAALWKISRHPRALPALLDELRNPVDGSRYAAIVAVGQIGPPAKSGVPDLLKALSARELYVRQAAAQSLARVDPAVPPRKAGQENP
jgi:HEAT repeat protein